MGCNVSRFEVVNGATFLKRLEAIKARHRPLKDSTTLSKKDLLSHQEDMKISVSSNPSNDTIVSPYSLQDIISKPVSPKAAEKEIETAPAPIKGVGIAIIISGNNYGIMKVVAEEKVILNIGANHHHEAKKESPKAKKEDAFVEDEDEDDEADERRIGYGDGEGFPGSPSFRVFFKENREDIHNEIVKSDHDAFTERISTGDHIVEPKAELSSDEVEKKVKREKMKKCFRKVLPKRGSQEAVKNLLNMKACYSLN